MVKNAPTLLKVFSFPFSHFIIEERESSSAALVNFDNGIAQKFKSVIYILSSQAGGSLVKSGLFH